MSSYGLDGCATGDNIDSPGPVRTSGRPREWYSGMCDVSCGSKVSASGLGGVLKVAAVVSEDVGVAFAATLCYGVNIHEITCECYVDVVSTANMMFAGTHLNRLVLLSLDKMSEVSFRTWGATDAAHNFECMGTTSDVDRS